jgi:hypothetical protein
VIGGKEEEEEEEADYRRDAETQRVKRRKRSIRGGLHGLRDYMD